MPNNPTAKAMLAAYIQAEAAILEGKTVSFQGRTVSLENLSEIRAGRKEWEKKAAAEEGRCLSPFGSGYGVATFGQRR